MLVIYWRLSVNCVTRTFSCFRNILMFLIFLLSLELKIFLFTPLHPWTNRVATHNRIWVIFSGVHIFFHITVTWVNTEYYIFSVFSFSANSFSSLETASVSFIVSSSLPSSIGLLCGFPVQRSNYLIYLYFFSILIFLVIFFFNNMSIGFWFP